MCELFAMSCRTPAAVTYSLNEFSRNGSLLRNNRDGWGIAMARDLDAILVKEAEPAIDSAWVRFIAEHPTETRLAIAHVRYATRGHHTMENTHPFRRVLGRRTHLFAHNGTLSGIEAVVDPDTLSFVPIGETDSELAFCALLTRLEPHFRHGETPTLETRFNLFHNICNDMRRLGPSNFLYYDGEVLFVHAHQRMYEEAGKFVGPRSPGLHLKKCWKNAEQKKISCPGLDVDLQDQQTVILASVPLDELGWEGLEEGTILAIKDGEILKRAKSEA